MKPSLAFILTIVFLLGRPFSGNGEVYTALVDMEGLLETERILAQTLSTLIQAQEDTLNKLKRYFSWNDLICLKCTFSISSNEIGA